MPWCARIGGGWPKMICPFTSPALSHLGGGWEIDLLILTTAYLAPYPPRNHHHPQYTVLLKGWRCPFFSWNPRLWYRITWEEIWSPGEQNPFFPQRLRHSQGGAMDITEDGAAQWRLGYMGPPPEPSPRHRHSRESLKGYEITRKPWWKRRTQVGEISKLYRQAIEKDAGLSYVHPFTPLAPLTSHAGVKGKKAGKGKC